MASIADVYVTVLPETGKIADGIKAALLKADKHVHDAAERWKKEIEEELKGIEVKIKVDKPSKAKAEKEIEQVAEDKDVALEPKVDKPSAAKAEGELDAVARDRTAKVKVKVDQASLKKATDALGKAAGIGKGKGVPIPGARGTVPPALGIEAIGAAPAVVPLISSMVQSVGQLSGALGLIPAAAGAAALAIGTLKIGMSGFADAIKEIGDPEKFAEAIKTLAPSAQQAAIAIQGLMPQVTQLKMTLQGALFAGLGEEFSKLGNTYLPIFQTVMGQMAVSANNAFKDISKMLQTPQMQTDIKTFGKNAAEAFDTLMLAAQPFVKALSDIMVVGSGFLPQLAATVGDLATRFADFIEGARESGKLAEWIQGGITAFTQLKDIAVNVWDIFKGIFQASDAGDFLDTVVRLTEQWATWVGSLEGQTALKQFFDDAKESAQRIWDLIVQWGPVLYDAFQGMKSVVDQVLPVITAIGEWLGRYGGLIQAAGAMWATWKLTSVLASIAEVGAAIIGLGGKGSIAGKAAGTGLRAGILAGFGGSLTIPILLAATTVGVGYGFGEAADRGQHPELSRFNEIQRRRVAEDRAAANDQSEQQISERRQGTPNAFVGGAVTTEWQMPEAAPGQVNRVQPSNAPPPAPPPELYQPPAPAEPGGGGSGGAGGAGGAESAGVEGPAAESSGFDWDAVAFYESGGDWADPDSGGTGHYGGLQFSPQTWRDYGGKGMPHHASRTEQMQIADRTAFYGYAGKEPQGLGAWEVITQGKVPGINVNSRPPATGAGGSGSRRRRSSYGAGAPQPVPYGLPGGTNTGGYGNARPGQFPEWVSGITSQFGVKPSTYPGHQESNRNEAGYAPNPQGLNRGIDWSGTPAQLRQMAEYLMQHPEMVEQLIYQDPETGKAYEISGGKVSPGYYGASTLAQHRGHAHTRQSQSWGPGMEMGDGYTYDGPGGDRGNPMYIESAKGPSGEQLGKDIVGGVMEIFGLGDLFKDPTQFGIFKIFKSLMGIKAGESNGGSTNADGGTGDWFGTGSQGSGSPLIDAMNMLVPGAPGSITDELIAGQGGGTGGLTGLGSLTDDITNNLVPAGGPTNITNNRNITVEGNADRPTVNALQNNVISDLRNTPRPH